MDNPLLKDQTQTNSPSPANAAALLSFDTTSSTNIVYDVATFYETTYWLENEYPPETQVISRFDIKKPQLEVILPAINKILDLRSLPPVELRPTPKPRNSKVDPFFAAAVNLLVDVNDKRSKAAKLKVLNLTTQKYEVLLNDPINRKYYEQRIAKLVKNTELTSDVALAKNVETGDLQSIKYFNEVTGKYRPEQNTSFLLGVIVGKLMEIMAKHLPAEQIILISEEFDQVLNPRELSA